MPDLPSLTVAEVRSWTNDRYYQRGEGYFHEDRIRRPRREGRTLKALCRGSQPSPYRVEVTLDTEGIAAGSCSCPIGDRGRCKHAVALLLTWVEEPDAFETVEPLADRLRDQSKETLITIVQRLVEREPSLESSVRLALDHPESDRAVDLRAYAEEAFAAGGLDPHDYGYGREVAEALDPLLERGHEHLEAERWAAAATVFGTVADVVQDQLDRVPDQEGALLSVLATCGDGLGRLLSASPPDATARDAALTSLLDLVLWDAEAGGIGVAGDADTALRAHTTDAEQARIADRLRDALPAAEDAPASIPQPPSFEELGDWKRRHLGGLLLDLERDRLDAEAYLDLCRRTGHWAECADRLLALDRVDEAVQAAQRLPDHALRTVLDRLVDAGADERARALATDRLSGDRPDPSLRRWLYEHALDAERYEQALEVARSMFRERPSPTTFDRVRRAARALGRWDEVRPALLQHLQDTHRTTLRTRLHLRANEVDAALGVVEPFAGPDRSSAFSPSFLTEVADAVRERRPDAAIALYEECARRRVAERGRSNYAEAADLLTKARTLYEDTGRPEAAEAFLDDLYEDELHRLPAARDEFQEAGLLS